eukprot:1187628-Prorocentrum_minimum.AAC.1
MEYSLNVARACDVPMNEKKRRFESVTGRRNRRGANPPLLRTSGGLSGSPFRSETCRLQRSHGRLEGGLLIISRAPEREAEERGRADLLRQFWVATPKKVDGRGRRGTRGSADTRKKPEAAKAKRTDHVGVDGAEEGEILRQVSHGLPGEPNHDACGGGGHRRVGGVRARARRSEP